jgi:hypothetical protein
MHTLRESSLEEYASWYLNREARKCDRHVVPAKPEEQVAIMRNHHGGKMRDWFNSMTRWTIVELDVVRDLGNLVFLESKWTKEEGLVIPGGPDYRILHRVASNATRNGYLGRPSAEKHRRYYAQLSDGSLQLVGENRISICSAEPCEVRSNPSAEFYLLDGVGRCLPYMILVQRHKQGPAPVEAFLAERGCK